MRGLKASLCSSLPLTDLDGKWIRLLTIFEQFGNEAFAVAHTPHCAAIVGFMH
jgi:hypothetical protein